MSENYNVTIEISDVETEKLKRLEQEVWRIRRMIQLMLDTCDEDAVAWYGSVETSITKVGE